MYVTLQKSLSYNRNSNFCPITLKKFIDILLPNAKPILVGVLYWPPDKPGFIEYPNNYLLGALNTNILNGNKILLDKQYYDSYSQAPP